SVTPSELKKQLIAAGLEIFRVQGNRIHLADRVRENLIMDGGVAAVVGEPLAVRFVVRAQSSQFPGESPDQLFGRARDAAAASTPRGYREVETSVVNINDPGGGPNTLDTWYEVAYEKPVDPNDLLDELRYALGVEKSASTG
ncbi:MAG TPA: hypothetical protein VHU80_11145, partial [Polyangiaceae bacterium]|nr:hypothetical protein [Polyangiaceae bacterium]